MGRVDGGRARREKEQSTYLENLAIECVKRGLSCRAGGAGGSVGLASVFQNRRDWPPVALWQILRSLVRGKVIL